MVVFDWLKEWSPVLNLVVVVVIAVIIFRLQRRMHLRTQTQNKINELMDWATEAWGLANEYFREKIVTQGLKNGMGIIIDKEFRLEISARSLGIEASFDEAQKVLRSLNRQLNQINLKDGDIPWGLTNEFQGRFFNALYRLLQDLVTKERKI